MKKLFLALIFSAVLFIGLPFYNVYAMPITYDVPFSSVPDSLSLLEDILSGAKINIQDYSTVDAFLEHYAETYGAKNFLSRQANKLASKLSHMALNGEQTINPNNDLVIPITVADLAYHMGYNSTWYENYINTPDVNLDVSATNFNTYFNVGAPNITSDCRFSNKTAMITFSPSANYESGFPTSDSWLVFNGALYVDIVDGHWHVSSPGYCTSAYAGDNNGLYMAWWTGYSWNFPIQSFSDTSRPANDVLERANNSLRTIDVNNMTAMLNYLPNFARNCTLYVNGQLYAWHGDAGLINAPDVIQIGDLPNWTYDVFFPKIEGLQGLSINQFLEWLQGQLDANDVDFIDLGMLIADEVPLLVLDDDDPETTPTTRPIEIEDTRPVVDVIEDDPTAPTPTPPTDDSILLPPFPIIDYSNIPNQAQHTVLAEIIDATQKTVPNELMTLIWSTFGLLVVGGLIYILHK